MPRAPDTEPPEGLIYRTGLIDADEGRELVDRLDGLAFHEIRMRGQVARRTARHYGIVYGHEERGRLTPGEPLPDWLLELRQRCGRLAGVAPGRLVEGLVQRYPPGASIGWHRDAPAFGIVVGLSLGGASRLRFQRGRGEERRTFAIELAPGSAYVLSGSARWAWQHSIPPTRELRYSITFRTLREGWPPGD